MSTACDDGDLTLPEALEAAEDIFRRNSLQLYKLHGVVQSSISLNKTSMITSHPDGITFVRIIWIDASAQHRCRVSNSFDRICPSIRDMAFYFL